MKYLLCDQYKDKLTTEHEGQSSAQGLEVKQKERQERTPAKVQPLGLVVYPNIWPLLELFLL